MSSVQIAKIAFATVAVIPALAGYAAAKRGDLPRTIYWMTAWLGFILSIGLIQ